MKDLNLYLIFLPVHSDEWTIDSYQVGILNRSKSDYRMTAQISMERATRKEKQGDLLQTDIFKLPNLNFTDLNNKPEYLLKFWAIEKKESDNFIVSSCMIKAKQFFAKKGLIPGTEMEGISYELKRDVQRMEKVSREDLGSYTKSNLKSISSEPSNKYYYSTEESMDLHSIFNFKDEIDLHIEELVQDFSKLDSAQKLDVQLKAVNEYLDQAIKLGQTKVFLIHGIGKGKLKDKIKDILHKHAGVSRHKNEYHHKYGYGATEVFLRKK